MELLACLCPNLDRLACGKYFEWQRSLRYDCSNKLERIVVKIRNQSEIKHLASILYFLITASPT